MTALTIRERIILHLGVYDMLDPDDVFNIPWDLTQDGIASSLRISRAHASIELKKLKMTGRVVERHAHIKGGKTKRKSYFLTPTGMNDASRIKEYVEEEGIDIMPLLDMKRCDPNALMDSMDDESKTVLGLACVLRCSVRRDTLPETKQSIVPVDVTGYVIISDEVKRNVLSVLEAEDIAKLHSTAADYWLAAEEPDRQERLYHLVRAGRMIDACRLIVNERNELMDNMNEDLLDILSEMTDIPERFVHDVLSMRITAALEFDDIDMAEKDAMALMTTDGNAAVYLADVFLAKGLPADALKIVEPLEGSIARDLRIAKAFSDMDRLEESRGLLEKVKSDISRSGDLELLYDVYAALSRVCIRMGVPEDALMYLNKARGGAGARDMRRIYAMMSEVYAAMGIAEEIKRS